MVVKKREHRKESGRKDEKINLILLSLVLSLIYGCSSFTSKTLDIAYLEEKVPAELLAYHLISTFDNDYIQDSPYDTKYSIILNGVDCYLGVGEDSALYTFSTDLDSLLPYFFNTSEIENIQQYYAELLTEKECVTITMDGKECTISMSYIDGGSGPVDDSTQMIRSFK